MALPPDFTGIEPTLEQWGPNFSKQLNPVADGNVVTSVTCLLAAGPPYLSMAGQAQGGPSNLVEDIFGQYSSGLNRTTAKPIGLAQGVNIGANRQQMRIYEIGSLAQYLVTGRGVGQITISRVVLNKSNLLRVLYAYYGTSGGRVTIRPLYESPAVTTELNDIYVSPGSESFFINLPFSDLFQYPLGLLLIMMTPDGEYFGSFYFEQTIIHGYNVALDAQGMLVQENVTASFGWIRMVKVEPALLSDAISNSLNAMNFLGVFG